MISACVTLFPFYEILVIKSSTGKYNHAVWSLCNDRRLAAIVSSMISKRKAASWQPCRIPRVICENRNKERFFRFKTSINRSISIDLCICVLRI